MSIYTSGYMNRTAVTHLLKMIFTSLYTSWCWPGLLERRRRGAKLLTMIFNELQESMDKIEHNFTYKLLSSEF